MTNDSKTDEVWTAIYWQYHVRDEDEFDSLEDAASFLDYGDDTNSLHSEAIRSPNGVIVTHDELKGAGWSSLTQRGSEWGGGR